jgi:uncharacterized Zn-binding protein involved in type VI secretion
MPQICRIGDTNAMKGAITNGASTVFANGILVGVQGSSISPHNNFKGPHNSATVSSGSSTVFADGKPVATTSSLNSCGHSMSQGSPDVFVP